MGSLAELLPMTSPDIKAYNNWSCSDEPSALKSNVYNKLPKSSNSFLSLSAPSISVQKLEQDTPYKRAEPFPIEKLPGNLPHGKVDPDVDHDAAVSSCLRQ